MVVQKVAWWAVSRADQKVARSASLSAGYWAAYSVVLSAVLWVSERAGRLVAALVAQRVAWSGFSRADQSVARTAYSLVDH